MQNIVTARMWILLLGLPLPLAAGAPVFTDITDTAGIAMTDLLVESVAWGDYDGDGDEDLYLTANGPNALFRNDGGGTFTDVTDIAGVGSTLFSVGTAFGDLDNDGDLDLYVVNFNVGDDVLYRNDGPVGPGGETVFTDVAAAAGIDEPSSSRGMAFLDFDHDGRLDIYVNAIGPDILYRNLGHLQFTNIASAMGVATPGQGVGVVATDIDGNGWVDLFTGNRSGDLNRLYLNDAGMFTDASIAAGIDNVGLGMGVLSLDRDNDLDFDLYWTAWPGINPPFVDNAFYDNLDGATFTDVAGATGTTDTTGWGISCNAGDIDNDGWMDFFVTNGFNDSSSANVLFHNDGDGTFTDATLLLGGGGAFDGRGVAFADFDDDGDLDIVVTADLGQPNRLWRNDIATGNHWVTFVLRGTLSNRSAFGARIEVTTDLGTTVQEVSGGAGRGSFNSLPVEFGLGLANAIEQVIVRWPSGQVQTLTGVAVDQKLTIIEPADVFADGFESGDLGAWSS